MPPLDALAAHWGDVAVLLLLGGAGLAALIPGRRAPLAIAAIPALAAFAAFAMLIWQALDFGGPGAQARIGLVGALIAAGGLVSLATEATGGGRVRAALIMLTGAGFAIAATYAAGGWGWLGLWVGGFGVIGLARYEPTAATRLGQLAALWGLACALGLLGAGLKMSGALQTGGARLEVVGATIELIGLLGVIGLAPFNLIQLRLLSQGGAAAIFLGVGAPCAALAMAVSVVASLDPTIAAGPLAWLAVIGLAAAAVFAVAAADLRGAIGALLAAQAAGIVAAFAVAAGAANRAAAEAAGLGVIALGLAGLASLAALDALAPDRRADIDALRGRGHRAPLPTLALVAALISLMGAPLSLAFLGRWLTMGAALETGWALGAAALVAVAFAAVVVTARWMIVLYNRTDSVSAAAPLSASIAALITAALGVWLGLAADWPLAIADLAFAGLIGGGAR